MESYVVMIYFAVALFTIGTFIAVAFRFRYSVVDTELKISGLWRNETNTIRILIYSAESKLKGEVVWTRNIDKPILGWGILQNLRLHYFNSTNGTYVDPLTNDQFKVIMKLKQPGRMSFVLSHATNGTKVEEWTQVHPTSLAI